MNRFETELKARGNILNGRKWHAERRGGSIKLQISEARTAGAVCESYMPGYWSGQPDIGFRALELAGCDRRRIATIPAYRTEVIGQFKRNAREYLELSRHRRLMAECSRMLLVPMSRAA